MSTYRPPTYANIARDLVVAFCGDRHSLSVRHTHSHYNPFLSMLDDVPVSPTPTPPPTPTPDSSAVDWARVLSGPTHRPDLRWNHYFAWPGICCYAAPYLALSRPTDDGIQEFIRPGAFDGMLTARRKVVVRLEHSTDVDLASTRDGTLALSADSLGLRAEFSLLKHNPQAGAAVVHLMHRHAHLWRYCSVGIHPLDSRYVLHSYRGWTIREWTELAVDELSLCSKHAAYVQTSAVLHTGQGYHTDPMPEWYTVNPNIRLTVERLAGV